MTLTDERPDYSVMGTVTGSHAPNGDIVVRWNSQVDSLRSPDGKLKLMPCDRCGRPQWVALNVVTLLCPGCWTEETGQVPRPLVRLEHDPLDTEQIPLAAFVAANLEDTEAMEALASLVSGRETEAVIGGGAAPVCVLSIVFVY